MRVLVSITYFNAADVISGSVAAVRKQTFPANEILIVDNCSTEKLDRNQFPADIVVFRNEINLGISGAVTTGLTYARDHGYDHVWLLDADSYPQPDALERLVAVVSAGDGAVGISAPSHNLLNLGRAACGMLLTPGGPRPADWRQSRGNRIACDAVIWSGALINLAVVQMVGYPRAGTQGCWEDLSIDYGDMEYSFRIRRAGYEIIVCRDAVIDHRLGDGACRRVFGVNFYSTNHSSFRRYLYFRNLVYFWLYIYPRHDWLMLTTWFSYRTAATVCGIMCFERQRLQKLIACLAGVRDGLLGRVNCNF